MKTIHLILIVTTAFTTAACSVSNKTKTVTPNPPVTEMQTSLPPFLTPANGIYAPGSEELTAIQKQFAATTPEQLKEGYVLYTVGACINCHEAKNIYKRGVEHWKNIIDNMAPMAKLSDTQKDAVYKYVLAIKATQPL